MTEIQSRVQAHQSRGCPCCGNDPCDLELDLIAHKGWTVPGMMHVDAERRGHLVILIEDALATLEAVLAQCVTQSWLRERDVLTGMLADLGEPEQERQDARAKFRQLQERFAERHADDPKVLYVDDKRRETLTAIVGHYLDEIGTPVTPGDYLQAATLKRIIDELDELR